MGGGARRQGGTASPIACTLDDFPVPAGLDRETMGFSGPDEKKQDVVDQVIFSPRCVPPEVDPQQEFGW